MEATLNIHLTKGNDRNKRRKTKGMNRTGSGNVSYWEQGKFGTTEKKKMRRERAMEGVLKYRFTEEGLRKTMRG